LAWQVAFKRVTIRNSLQFHYIVKYFLDTSVVQPGRRSRTSTVCGGLALI
jgi:hypothetical protein